MDTASKTKKIGRPPKKNYDEAAQFKKLLDDVSYCYEITGEIKATAIELDMNPIRVKKLLITSGKLEYEETAQIQRLLSYGKSLLEIQKEMGLKKSSINSYLPYSKLPYKEDEVSANADRCDLYRKRKAAVEAITDRESLYKCLKLFEDYIFVTSSGNKFKYYCDSDKRNVVIKDTEATISFENIADWYENKRDIFRETGDESQIAAYVEAIVRRLSNSRQRPLT